MLLHDVFLVLIDDVTIESFDVFVTIENQNRAQARFVSPILHTLIEDFASLSLAFVQIAMSTKFPLMSDPFLTHG